MSPHPKYEEDFYAWTQSTADLLKNKEYNQVDFEHVIEEIEFMGASERRELVNRLAQLIFHLLKWQYQPDFRGRSWSGSIDEQRKKLRRLLRENPSLNNRVSGYLLDAHEDALALVKKETPIDLSLLPTECLYSIEELLDEQYYPN